MKRLQNSVLAATLILGIGVVFTSCKKKPIEKSPVPAGEVTILEKCSGQQYFSDKNTFRATATGESMDRETAKKKARSNANAELAKTIKVTMKIVGDNYVNSSEFNNKEEVTETFNEMSRTVVDQELQGAMKICDELTRNTSTGNYVAYIAIELSGTKLADSYNDKLSKDERIKVEYNYEKFKETFEEEMRKLEEQN
ncbi:MAG: hypothetical protein ACI9EA_001074 [Pseudomonadales bacterium]|jgi:hypothetical protein|tara:strand:+ start:681 stop:1271 length:591 start_codon:yes stop_codon:yes gene_type:complete